MHPTDPTAVARPILKRGDREQMEALYRTHHQAIWRTLRRLGFSPEAAADATHQAYVIASERLQDIVAGSEKAYLFAVAIRFAKTAARKDRRTQYEEEIDLGADPKMHADALVDRQMARVLLDRVLAHMKE